MVVGVLFFLVLIGAGLAVERKYVFVNADINGTDLNVGTIVAGTVDANAVFANYYVARNYIDANFLMDASFNGDLNVSGNVNVIGSGGTLIQTGSVSLGGATYPTITGTDSTGEKIVSLVNQFMVIGKEAVSDPYFVLSNYDGTQQVSAGMDGTNGDWYYYGGGINGKYIFYDEIIGNPIIFEDGNISTGGTGRFGQLMVDANAVIGTDLNVRRDLNVFGKIVVPGSISQNSGQFGTFGLQSYAVNNAWLSDNAFFNSGFKYKENGYASLFYFAGREFQIRTGDTGTKGAALIAYTRLKVNNNGTFALGGQISNINDNLYGASLWGNTTLDVFAARDFNVGRNLFVTQDLNVRRDLNVGRDVNVTRDVNVGRNLNVDKNVWVDSNLRVVGNSRLDGNVSIGATTETYPNPLYVKRSSGSIANILYVDGSAVSYGGGGVSYSAYFYNSGNWGAEGIASINGQMTTLQHGTTDNIVSNKTWSGIYDSVSMGTGSSIVNGTASNLTLYVDPLYFQVADNSTWNATSTGQLWAIFSGLRVLYTGVTPTLSASGTQNNYYDAYGTQITVATTPIVSSGNWYVTNTGTYIDVVGTTAGYSTNYGIWLARVSGADTSYSIYDNTDANWVIDSDQTRIVFGEDYDVPVGYDAGSDSLIVVEDLNVIGNIGATGSVIATAFVDLTPAWEGTSEQALNEIVSIKSKDGKIDHSTLPDFTKKGIPQYKKVNIGENCEDRNTFVFDENGVQTKTITETVCEPINKIVQSGTIEGRDLGAMVTMQTEAIKELKAQNEELKAALCEIKPELETCR